VRYEFLTAVNMSILVQWVVTPRRLVADINVSEEHTASIFNPEACSSETSVSTTGPHGVATQKNNIVIAGNICGGQ
jgi:hypothetical protein